MKPNRVMPGKDRAEWLADKICNGGDFGKEAAFLLVRQAEEIEKLKSALRRLVSYYDDPRCGDRLPAMTMQARSQHENTMFGEARAVLKHYELPDDVANCGIGY